MQHLLENKLFPYVNKPGRYIGGEPGQIVKSPDNRFKIALGYPDMYEIGMSYLGLRILYNIINREDRFLCERFFAPDTDAGKILREENIPLFSLESFRPLSEFDVIGLTLAYEMVFTNVLSVLDLSGIPLHAVDRTDKHPIVIAGGPVAYNPEPMSAFFDAFYLGDGEETIVRLLDCLAESKNLKRRERLEKLVGEVPSIYVPQFYDEKTRKPIVEFAPEKIESYRTAGLKSEFYDCPPLIPFIETVHDRLTVEIMRGCPQRCRFCQATEIYKPVRIRSKEEIISQIKKQLVQTGYDEVSLLSLSSSDYPEIVTLMVQLSRSLLEQKVALSLPSLRPGTFCQEVADAVKATRKTGLTFAPEAGTERLRAVIRKDITDKDLFDTLELVFKNEWNSVKLYFMIGLPTETEEDIKGIVNMIRKAASIARNSKGRKTINVRISPFSPKSHTPFQWDEQPSPEIIRQKNDYIKRQASHPLVDIKLRDPHLSFLEGIIGRGGRELCSVIETAFKSGARFDGWSEYFNFDLWIKAFKDNSLNPYDYLKGKTFSEDLPWSHIKSNRSIEYLIEERNRTSVLLKEARKKAIPEIYDSAESDNENAFGRGRKKIARTAQPSPIQSRVRFKWGRRGLVRFLSHLDNMRTFERAIRRAGFPADFTLGFHPHMKLSFGPPLQLGYTSEAEYFDLTLTHPFQANMVDELNDTLPEGFFVLSAGTVIDKKTSISGKLNRAVYEVSIEPSSDIQNKIDDLMAKEVCEIERETKTEAKTVDIRPAVFVLEYREANSGGTAVIYMELGVGSAGYAKPSEILQVAGIADERVIPALNFHRKDLLYIDELGNRYTPMEF